MVRGAEKTDTACVRNRRETGHGETATGRVRNSLGAQHRPPAAARASPGPPLVRRTDAHAGLEPRGSSGADRKEGPRAAGESRHQLQPRAPAAAVRAGPPGAQRPYTFD